MFSNKVLQSIGLALLIITGLFSCEVDDTTPIIVTEGSLLDPDLYPGDFDDYEIPEFEENLNIDKNVLLTVFDGHQCAGCDFAITAGDSICAANPGRAFMANLHAGPGEDGTSAFQVTSATYTYDFTNPIATEMAAAYWGDIFRLFSIPRGSVNNRVSAITGYVYNPIPDWGAETSTVLTAPIEINLQAKSNYFSATNAVYLHVETDFEVDITGDYNLIVFAMENEIIAPQKVGADYTPGYLHTNIHKTNVSGNTWGTEVISGSVESGTKFLTNLSYALPAGLDNTDMHFLIFVMDTDNKEIMQVIKHEF